MQFKELVEYYRSSYSAWPWPMDYCYFYVAGNNARRGMEVFTLFNWPAELAQTCSFNNSPVLFTSVPWSIWLFSLFSMLPFWVGYALLSILSLSSCISIFIAEVKGQILKANTYFVLTLLAFFPIFKTLWFGQISLLILFCLYFSLKLFRDRPLVAGILLSMVLMKPQLLGGIAVGALLSAFTLRNYKFLYGFSISFFLQLMLSLAVAPTSFFEFAGNIELHSRGQYFANIGYLLNLFELSLESKQLIISYLFVPGFILSVIIARASLGKRDLRKVYTLAVPISLLFAPYLWAHDLVYLIPGLIPILRGALSKSYLLTGAISVLLFLCAPILVHPSVIGEQVFSIWSLIVLTFGFLICIFDLYRGCGGRKKRVF